MSIMDYKSNLLGKEPGEREALNVLALFWSRLNDVFYDVNALLNFSNQQSFSK